MDETQHPRQPTCSSSKRTHAHRPNSRPTRAARADDDLCSLDLAVLLNAGSRVGYTVWKALAHRRRGAACEARRGDKKSFPATGATACLPSAVGLGGTKRLRSLTFVPRMEEFYGHGGGATEPLQPEARRREKGGYTCAHGCAPGRSYSGHPARPRHLPCKTPFENPESYRIRHDIPAFRSWMPSTSNRCGAGTSLCGRRA